MPDEFDLFLKFYPEPVQVRQADIASAFPIGVLFPDDFRDHSSYHLSGHDLAQILLLSADTTEHFLFGMVFHRLIPCLLFPSPPGRAFSGLDVYRMYTDLSGLPYGLK